MDYNRNCRDERCFITFVFFFCVCARFYRKKADEGRNGGKRRMRDGTAEKEALPEAIEKGVFWQKELYG